MAASICTCDYIKQRTDLIKKDRSVAIGATIELDERETLVNDYLMKFKYEELDKGFLTPESFLAANHFFKVKKEVEKSKVFNLIKEMPKGSSLHSHDTAMVSLEYLYTITLRPNLYFRIKDDALTFYFFNKNKVPQGEDWKLVSEKRAEDPKFDEFLKARITMIRDDPERAYPDLTTTWTAFQNLFINLEKMITFKPVFKDYFYQVLKESYEENVKYIEFRGYLPTLYDLDGNLYKEDQVVGLYCETLTQFMCEYSDFVGCKFIFAPHRMVDKAGMAEYARIFKLIKEKYPRFVVGFDLVGQEDLGAPLSDFLNELLDMRECGARFFFHAGETHWNGQPTDMNLFDAVLLGTVRIGHGYAILKHPAIANIVKEKKIAVEVSPISNQVLKLCDDLRSHPASIMLANDYPVVICNDDPCWWGAKGISYDWYMAFMGLGHRDADLRFLKKLALNSIEFTGLDAEEKRKYLDHFKSDWNKFLTRVVQACQCGKGDKNT